MFEILIHTKDLTRALSFANSIVEKRNVLTELSNIKLVAKAQMLAIGATDMDLYLNQEIGVETLCEGETTVSTQTLSEIIRKIPDTTIKLIQTDNSNTLKIIGKNCYFELITLPTIQFPAMEEIDSSVNLTMKCSELAKIIEYTNFSISTDETRYNLNGIYMQVEANNFFGVATDGHRLSVAHVTLDQNIEKFGVIVPRKTATELSKILKDSQNIHSDISLSLSNTKIKFQCNNLTLISKLIDGTFPEYNSFVPTDNKHILTINRSLLAESIERVATITVDKFRAVKLQINPIAVEITAIGESKGSAKEILTSSDKQDRFCHYAGSDILIGFNPKYLNDVLSAMHAQMVEIYFKDVYSPILIKAQDNPNDYFVVMPFKV
ncbi:MAG: DNA polymerase III subunit beta [Rickettsiaceae bacterium]